MAKRYGWIVLALMLGACGGSDNPAGPSGSSGSSGSGTSGSSGHGTLTAVIDGVSYTGTIGTATHTNNVLNIASNSADLKFSVNFAATVSAAGSQVINSVSTMQMQVIQTNGSSVTGNWIASILGGSGTLAVTTLTATGASGTFNFVAPAAPGSTSSITSRTVTNGVFTATF